MSFLSMKFLLFLAAAVAGYYVIPRQLQWVWLLIFSYIFYLASGPGGGSVHPDHVPPLPFWAGCGWSTRTAP